MPTYTVHAPPLRQGETTSAAERYVFVRDGFHFWAFLLAPLWLLIHRLWLAFAIYAVCYGLIAAALNLLRVPASAQFAAGLVVALLIGFEASSIWRATLARRGWITVGFVVGEDTEIAERRFFAEWNKHPGNVSPVSSEPKYSTPIRRGPPSSSDVLGLFPEPGAQR
jgi:hypothetical protein